MTTDFGRALGSLLGLPWRVSAQVGVPYGRPPIDTVCTGELYGDIPVHATARSLSSPLSKYDTDRRPYVIFGDF